MGSPTQVVVDGVDLVAAPGEVHGRRPPEVSVAAQDQDAHAADSPLDVGKKSKSSRRGGFYRPSGQRKRTLGPFLGSPFVLVSVTDFCPNPGKGGMRQWTTDGGSSSPWGPGWRSSH